MIVHPRLQPIHVSLGAVYWSAITYTTFHEKNAFFPLLRVSLGLVNLTAPKAEDGVGRLLTKQDVVKVAGKANASLAKEAEQTLHDALKIYQTLKDTLPDGDQLIQPLGQLFVRMGLHVAGKGKQGLHWQIS